MPQGGFEPAQNLSSGLVEWSCAVVITTTPWRGWRSASTYVAKVGCPFWIYQMLPLNSKVGSDLRFKKYVLHYAIWHYLHNLKNEKNTHGRVLLLVKLQANGTNGTKSRKASHIFKHVLYLSCQHLSWHKLSHLAGWLGSPLCCKW